MSLIRRTLRIAAGCSALALVATVTPAQAQERSAGSTLDTQMTWTTLANLVEAANANSKAANVRIDQSILCNKKFMAYAPGAPGADRDGCIENELIKQLAKRMDQAELDIKATLERLDALDARLTAEVRRIDASLADLSGKIALLNTRVGVVEKDMAALQTRMAAVEASVKALTTRVASLENDVAVLASRVTAAENTIKTHTTQIAALTKDVNTLKSEMDALEKLVNTLSSRVTTTENKLNWISSCNSSGKLWGGSGSGCKTINVDSGGLSSCVMEIKTITSSSVGNCPSGYLFTGGTRPVNSTNSTTYCARVKCS